VTHRDAPFVSADPRRRTGLQNTASLHRLLSLPGIGHAGAALLAERHDTWEEFLASDPGHVPGRSSTKALALLRAAAKIPEPVLPPGVRAVSCFDDDWPSWLDFDGGPVIVFYRGTLPPGGGLAIVGTREPTAFGARAVRAYVAQIAREERSVFAGIVSGLARGVDTIAHVEALEHGIPTWAILGSGVDRPTPQENVPLAERLLAAGGGLLSEQLPGTQPIGGTFIQRNRLQVAAASRVFIAECGAASGTMHTARFAVVHGKELVVADPRSPGDASHPATEGNRILLDPRGCDPGVLHAKGEIAALISVTKPVADRPFPV
jgi:DNA processing protein